MQVDIAQRITMEPLPLKRYLAEIYHFSEDELFNLCNKGSYHFYWNPVTGEIQMDPDYNPDWTNQIFNMVYVLSSLPGIRPVIQVIDLMGRDGYDFTSYKLRLIKSAFYEPGGVYNLLDVLTLNSLRPFGPDVLQALVRNGLSRFHYYYTENKSDIGYLLEIMISSCSFDSTGHNIHVQHRAQTMMALLLSLGLNRNYKAKDVKFTKYFYFNYDEKHEAFEALKAQVLESRKQPLSLLQLARMATRRALGGRNFAKKVAALPLPPIIRDYVQAVPSRGAGPGQSEPSQTKRSRASDDDDYCWLLN